LQQQRRSASRMRCRSRRTAEIRETVAIRIIAKKRGIDTIRRNDFRFET